MYANLRYAVQPKAVTGLNIPYSEIKGVTHKKATVAKMTKSSAELSTGEVIDFDFAVIATGSTNGGGVWAQPQGTTLAEREAEVKVRGLGRKAQGSPHLLLASHGHANTAAHVACSK
eukprot:359328-Chlamydomonas_euryale.AAC.11